jgi:hypothetical protein
VGTRLKFQTKEDAMRRCRQLAKTKMKMKDYETLPLERLPKTVQEHLEVPVEMQISPEEMVKLIAQAKLERYVVFEDVDGIEDYFNAGIEYIGYLVEDDFLEVHDKFGDLRHCFASRMSSVRLTERAEQVGGGNA